MKMAMTALAVVLLAQAAPALAEPGEHGRSERPPWAQGRGHGDGDGGRGRGVREAPAAQPAPAAAPAPRARPAPQALEPRVTRGEREGRRVWGDPTAQPGRWAPRSGQPGPAFVDRGDRRVEGQRDAPDGRADTRRWEGRGEGERQQWRRREADRRDWDRGDNVRHYDGRRDWDRRDWSRREGDRRYDGRRDWNRGYVDRRYDGRRDWDRRDWDRDGRRDSYRYWERGRYPSVYISSHRYHHSWRAPAGYYVRVWSFGEYLPHSWYGPAWWIVDPWAYDLPLPPPGCDWVRVGDDALLVDQFTGLIVQVVRDVFW